MLEILRPAFSVSVSRQRFFLVRVCSTAPPGRLLIASPYFGGENQDFLFRGFYQFWWVNGILAVCRRTKNMRPLRCPRPLGAYRSARSADCDALACFLYVLLNAGNERGTGVYPREDNALGLFAFGSHPASKSVSRFTRPRCRPAWFPGWLRSYL